MNNQATPQDKYELAARIAIAGLDGFNGRMTAKQQRELFGAAPFGKKVINIDATNQGVIWGFYSTAYGTDSVRFEWTLEETVNKCKSNFFSF